MGDNIFKEIDEKLKRGKKVTYDECLEALEKGGKKAFVVPISDKGAIELNKARRVTW